jgi:hypothetical protein
MALEKGRVVCKSLLKSGTKFLIKWYSLTYFILGNLAGGHSEEGGQCYVTL